MMANAIPAGCGALQRGNRDAPAARRTDPASSRAAAAHMARSGRRLAQQDHAAAAVRALPGHTSFELAMLTRLDRYMLARRLPEIERAGHVCRAALHCCTVTGRLALTWMPGGAR